MIHIKKFDIFNESNNSDKEFLVEDKSGRGIKSKLNKNYIEQTWDLSETDDDDEVTLAEFLDDAKLGDVWETRTVRMTCI